MSGNGGGPWGGGGGGGDKRPGGNGHDNGGGQRPGNDGPQIPEIDEIVKKGQEHLRVLMGGRGGGKSGGGSGDGQGPQLTRGKVLLGLLAVVGLWLYASFYTVKPEEKGVELFLGKYLRTTDDGPHMAWWPLVSVEVIPVTTEQSETIGAGENSGLMLTGDENIVDMDFQVVWNINNPQKFLFTLRDPGPTIAAVAESAMREIVAQSELAPLLNTNRESTAQRAKDLIQFTLDEYESGINIVRVNLDKAQTPNTPVRNETPRSPREAFLEVQAAEQTRDRLEKEADAYANRALAGARGQAAQLLEIAEGYAARVVNEAEGEASRFLAVLEEYNRAPDVTRQRLYLERLEEVLGQVDKIIVDDQAFGSEGGQGVVPYLPLNELRRGETAQ